MCGCPYEMPHANVGSVPPPHRSWLLRLSHENKVDIKAARSNIEALFVRPISLSEVDSLAKPGPVMRIARNGIAVSDTRCSSLVLRAEVATLVVLQIESELPSHVLGEMYHDRCLLALREFHLAIVPISVTTRKHVPASDEPQRIGGSLRVVAWWRRLEGDTLSLRRAGIARWWTLGDFVAEVVVIERAVRSSKAVIVEFQAKHFI